MNITQSHRYYRTKIVPVGDQGDSDCITIYSKRAAEFSESDFERDLRTVFRDVCSQDDFGIVSLFHAPYEFLIEHTNKGFSIRAFNMGRPEFSLDKLVFNLQLGDLLK